MTNGQIDRLLGGDPAFGIVPLVAAKAIKDVVARKEPTPVAPVIVVPPPPPPPPPGAGLLPLLAVSLLGLGTGAGIGYMLSRRA
jgi:hypothetical protein